MDKNWYDYAKLLLAIVAVLTIASTLTTLHRQHLIASADDPVATACAMAEQGQTSQLCIVHEQQVRLLSYATLNPLHD